MSAGKKCLKSAVVATLAAMGLVSGVIPNEARAANLYFDTNGTSSGYGISNGGSYSWDANNWATATGGTTTTGAWGAGDFARFNGGSSGNAYTVTVNNSESMSGLYDTVSGVSMTFSGTGNFNLLTGNLNGFLNASSAHMTINVPLTGPGAFEPENGGSISIQGTNTYTGGTTLASSATLTYFNHGSVFGTGSITIAEASGSVAPLLAQGGTTLTIPNNWTNTVNGGGINFAADASTPVVCSGTWDLGAANNLYLKNNGISSSPLTLSNTISDSGSITIAGANSGAIIFTGANTYTGTTTVGASGATAITFKLGASNTLGDTSSLILAGGTLDPDGMVQDMSAHTTLGMTASSAITYAAGDTEVDFKNSSALTWTGTLNITNWVTGVTLMRFGTTSSGLTTAQLADIDFNGAAGHATLTSTGYLVPEPTTAALLLLGAPLLAARRRRRN